MMEREKGILLEGRARARVVNEHLEWLAGRWPSEAIRAERGCRLTALAVFMAQRRTTKRGRKRER